MCPIPPSSMVNREHGYGVGIGHTALPHGHMCITILVHGEG